MRKYILLFVCCSMLVLLTAQTAPAALVTAEDPGAILALAKGYGFAELDTDKDGDPLIAGRIEGEKYIIVFQGCSNGKNCRSIQFATYWEKNIKYEDINAWNNKVRYTRAYINTKGNLWIELDVMLRHGMTEKNLDEYFSIWKNSLKAFKKEVLKE